MASPLMIKPKYETEFVIIEMLIGENLKFVITTR